MNHTNLWAPWRMAYLRDLEQRAATAANGKNGKPATSNDADGCFFRTYWAQPDNDEIHGVLLRDAYGMIMLNRYPYANGHLLVALGRSCPTITAYDPQERAAFWKLMEQAMELVDHALHPQGINAGLNIGRAAGAGVPEHVHGHVVPRWGGDTNFITVVGAVRVIPDSLEAMYQQYRQTMRDLGWLS
jgi:ATP adenylyltransferase